MMTVDSVRAALAEHGGLPELDACSSPRPARCAPRPEAVTRRHATARRARILRPLQEQVHAEALSADPSRAAASAIAGALIDASDRIANSLDTLAAEIRRQTRPRTA